MIKGFFILLIIAIAVGFVINQIPSLKQRVIEVINPAAKEGRLLGELTSNLSDLGSTINQLQGSKSSKDLENKIQNSRTLLDKSKRLLNNISSINQNNSGVTGIIGSQIGKIANLISDKTPYPADHLSATSPSTGSTSSPQAGSGQATPTTTCITNKN